MNTCSATPNCPRPVYARGICQFHYGRWYRHGDPLWEPAPKPRRWPFLRCNVGDCPKRARSRGMCDMHYTRWRKHGDPLFTLAPPARPKPPPRAEVLAAREAAVRELHAQGLRPVAIATQVGVSERTVYRIAARLGLAS